MPPYEFYARLLGADGGRKAFRARLGVEVDDVLDEFLALTIAYEQSGTPGLEGFLAWMAAAPTEIKRELTNTKGMVRIMTVHGSKGLEARIVVLVDPGQPPSAQSTIRPSCRASVWKTIFCHRLWSGCHPRRTGHPGTTRRWKPCGMRRRKSTGACCMWL